MTKDGILGLLADLGQPTVSTLKYMTTSELINCLKGVSFSHAKNLQEGSSTYMQKGLAEEVPRERELLEEIDCELVRDPFTPILRLRDESKFTHGAEQQETFDKIKDYLSTSPVLRAPKRGASFKLYITAKENIIGAIF